MQKIPESKPGQPVQAPPAKNKFSIENSAAFRKANHEAMEAIKTSVAKLKAERDRFFREEGKVGEKRRQH